MSMTVRENFMRNASLEGHEWIPQSAAISSAYWHEAREDLEDVCLRHPILFPGFQKGRIDFDACVLEESQKKVVDEWGCEWDQELDGLIGIVTGNPLADWDALGSWRPPAPELFNDDKRAEFEDATSMGDLRVCHTEHGFFFMRLYYLRGFDNFMMDVAVEDERLDQLVALLADHWEAIFLSYIDAGIDLLSTADDQGTQTASMLGPKYFARWLAPTYKRLYGPARASGAHVFMHNDGYVMDIMDQIIDCGVSIVNPQDLVNGIDNIAKEIKGRVCVRIDIDRQDVVPFGSPNDVHDLIKEEVMKLGSPEGGLEMIVGLYPPTPLENVEALFSAMEEYRTYWADR